MKQSALFTRTRREPPKDEVARNAQLLIRAGYIHKELAGVYSFLPLGWRTLRRIIDIIRHEMNAIGGQEVHLSALQNRALWEQTDRWSDEKVDIWFKVSISGGGEAGLAPTHEEPITALMREHIQSYRDLPQLPYQIQIKYRNEPRARSGILRGREFFMKDMYSFARSPEEHETLYEQVKQAYRRIYHTLELGDRTYLTFASGGIFSRYSHEFQTVTDVGEDTIYVDEERRLAVNEEVLTDEVLADLGLDRDRLVKRRAVEVGNIFSLGTRFSEALQLTFRDERGELRHPIMGCYGLGPTRVMGLMVELFADERGLRWPPSIAPYAVHLLALGDDVRTVADELYQLLTSQGITVLYDDRSLSVGEKLYDADLLGMPLQLRVGPHGLAQGCLELVDRWHGGAVRLIPRADVLTAITSTLSN